MARRVTLFTGQWADLPLADVAARAAGFGYDGLELACWGDHLDAERAAADPACCAAQRALLDARGGSGTRLLGDLQPPGRTARLRPERRALFGQRRGRQET